MFGLLHKAVQRLSKMPAADSAENSVQFLTGNDGHVSHHDGKASRTAIAIIKKPFALIIK